MTGRLERDEFAGLIASGENSFVEFKDPRVGNRGLAKELCAFANSRGGHILIGVGDDGELLDAPEWNDERAMDIARTAIDPPLTPTFQRLRWDDETTVSIVGVEMGPEKPYAVRSGEARRYYVRAGATSREASREELIRLTQASGAVASDLRPVLGASLDDLAPELIEARFADLRTVDFAALDAGERRRLLEGAEILHPQTGCPTIAGLLCFGSRPQSKLAYAEVSCVAYPGDRPGAEIVDRVTADGRVEEQIERAVEFIERNLATGSSIAGLRRKEHPRPSEESLREVVVNAVAHRHYGISGPCHVRVFSDRIEVANPGEPPNGVTPDGMRIGISVRRNQLLVQRLLDLGLMDAIGRGIVLLYREAADLGLRPPTIVAGDRLTKVTLFLQ